MKTIIAIVAGGTFGNIPVYIEPNLDLIAKVSRGRKMAISAPAIISPSLAQHKLTTENGLTDDEYEKIIPAIGNASSHALEVKKFWDPVREKFHPENIDYADNIMEAAVFRISGLRAEKRENENYYFEKSFYHMLFGRAELFYKAMSEKGIEVLVTDFFIAHCLAEMKKGEFEILNVVPANFDTEKELSDFHEVFSEYRMFEKWNPDAAPFLKGTWNLTVRAFGDFSMYGEPNESGEISGIISDNLGLATYKGRIKEKEFNFTKRYMLGSVANAAHEMIDRNPIYYTFNMESGLGMYCWKNKKGMKQAETPCMIDVSKKKSVSA
jgi:hypothetical protein